MCEFIGGAHLYLIGKSTELQGNRLVGKLRKRPGNRLGLSKGCSKVEALLHQIPDSAPWVKSNLG